MEFIFGVIVLIAYACSPDLLGTSALFFSAVPQILFAVAIRVVGGHGWRDMMHAFDGDVAPVLSGDRKVGDEKHQY